MLHKNNEMHESDLKYSLKQIIKLHNDEISFSVSLDVDSIIDDINNSISEVQQ